MGVPKSTQKQTNWCLNLWTQWAEYRSKKLIDEAERQNLLSTDIKVMKKSHIKFWLTMFIVEICRKDGKPYPPNTLHQIVCRIARALTKAGRTEIDIFNDPDFLLFQYTLDSLMKQLKSTGNFEVTKAEVITEELDLLWNKGLLGDYSPQVLLDTVLF